MVINQLVMVAKTAGVAVLGGIILPNMVGMLHMPNSVKVKLDSLLPGRNIRILHKNSNAGEIFQELPGKIFQKLLDFPGASSGIMCLLLAEYASAPANAILSYFVWMLVPSLHFSEELPEESGPSE